jgi:hypothetical protein
LRRLYLGREEARESALASAETLHFVATHPLSLTFFPTWLRGLGAREPLSASVRLVADNIGGQKFTIFGAAG